MEKQEMEPKRWVYRGQRYIFTGGKQYNLSIGSNGQVIGTYSSPTEAAEALATRSTENARWNETLQDEDVPKKIRDWEPESDDLIRW
ncbi:hypothetical protein [Geomonas edaphica]|uniref:hypothetical protein n=1 Tax=Geomonas edaphica TaxID=2570226 RepID=UPI0010A86CCA|nr:hypothetical protein [Geomonas edaphica]